MKKYCRLCKRKKKGISAVMVPKCGTSTLLMMQMMMRLRRARRRLRNHLWRRRRGGYGRKSCLQFLRCGHRREQKGDSSLRDWFSKSRSRDGSWLGSTWWQICRKTLCQTTRTNHQTKCGSSK